MTKVMKRSNMSLPFIYSFRVDNKSMKDDAILSLLSGTSLMLTKNDVALCKCCILELVNGAIVEFYEFVDILLDMQLASFENNITKLSIYMMIKLLYDVDINVFIPGTFIINSDN